MNYNIVNSQDIFELADYVIKDPEYTKLVPSSGQDFTSISISKVPEVLKVKPLMIRLNSILKNKYTLNNRFKDKNTLNNRFSNYVISEFGINYIKANSHTLELKSLVQQINFCTSINNPLNLDLDRILLTGKAGDDNKIPLFISKRQRDDMKLIQDRFGCKTEGSVAYFCVLLAINNAFGRYVSAGGWVDTEIDDLELYADYCNGSQIDSVNAEVQKFAEVLYPYIKAGRKYLAIILEDHNSKKAILSDNQVKHILNVLEQIDKLELDEKVKQLWQ